METHSAKFPYRRFLARTARRRNLIGNVGRVSSGCDALALLKGPQIARMGYIFIVVLSLVRRPGDKIELIAAQPSNEARVKTLCAYFRVDLIYCCLFTYVYCSCNVAHFPFYLFIVTFGVTI